MHNKKSIASDYFYIILIGIITIMALSLFFTVYLYFTEKKRLYDNIVQSAEQIENSINNSFDYSTELAAFIGTQIIEQGATNYDNIASILSSQLITNALTRTLFAYTIFDWITPEKQLVISGPYGILNKPKDVSFRHYSRNAEKDPWKLHFDNPNYGIPSGQYILPAGMGIVDKEGKFIGILSMGFNLSNLSNIAQKNIADKRIRFIILSKDGTPLFASFEGHVSFPPLPNKIRNIPSNKIASGYLLNNFVYNNIKYIFYKKFSKYSNVVLVGYDQEVLNKEIYVILIPRLTELLSIGAISILLLLIIRKRVVVPLIHLSDIAKKISDGITKLEIPKFSSFEMNILANQLKNVISYTTNLEQKVQERTFELEQALAIKTEFLNNISHEIRTPIQGFTNISEGLVEHWNDFDDERKFELANQIAINANRLSSLLNHLLDLSKFQAGKMILDLKQIKLNDLLESSVDECKNLYVKNKQLNFKIIATQTNNLITADLERLQQVIRNLLTNAIKFSPNNGSITILIQDTELILNKINVVQATQITVKDEGISIPEHELRTIFLPFTQSSLAKAGGTGLGLTISKEIIAAHHGKIWAENNSDQGGSIHFVIPNTPTFILNMPEKINYHDKEKSENMSTTILMIDGEDACLISMELLLHDTNYNLITTKSGLSGLNYLKTYHKSVDIILLDLMMPDIYGINVLTEIKQNPLTKNIPVILQTGIYDQQEIKKAYALGIVSYIKKPYQKQIVLTELSKALY
ncbi:Sensory/regulatory protein RpfC [Rickettsiales bacterium Ac37b]|nr:Sensory/regulatory protein RpfC [Rickettsiales bacterium Ac37b]